MPAAPPPGPPARPPEPAASKRPRPAANQPGREELAAVGEDAEESRLSRSANPLAVFAATVLVVAVAVGIWWFGRDSEQTADGMAADPSQDEQIVVDQDDPLPELKAAQVTRDAQGDPVFAWSNPSPQQGDQYRWWLLATPDNVHTVGEVLLALPEAEFGKGAVCIEVQLVREERASTQKLRICEQ
jgi:hypothetical protein